MSHQDDIDMVHQVINDMMMAYATSANLNGLRVNKNDAERMLEILVEELAPHCLDSVSHLRDNGYEASCSPEDSDKLVAAVVERANRKLAIRFIRPFKGYVPEQTYRLPDTKAQRMLAAGVAFNAEN